MSPRIVFVLGAPNDTQGRLSAIACSRADKALALQRHDPQGCNSDWLDWL